MSGAYEAPKAVKEHETYSVRQVPLQCKLITLYKGNKILLLYLKLFNDLRMPIFMMTLHDGGRAYCVRGD